MNYEPFVIFKRNIGLMRAGPGALFCLDPQLEASSFQPGSFKPHTHTPSPPLLATPGVVVVIGGGLECLKCHISPLSSDLLFSQKRASMLLADPLWMQVDLMWHISSSITAGSWVRKAGTGRWCERRQWRGGPGPDTFCPGQLKSLQPPPSPSGLIQHSPPWPEALHPPSAVMDKKPAHALGVLKLH